MRADHRLALFSLLLLLPLLTLLGLTRHLQADELADPASARAEGNRLMQAGNWKEALAFFTRLATDPTNVGAPASQDLRSGEQCLQRLGNLDEIDGFIEKAVTAHPKDAWVLLNAAGLYLGQQHNGSIVAGQFHRGPHRGGTARYVDCFERDRIRALQLLQQGAPFVAEAASSTVQDSSVQESPRMKRLREIEAMRAARYGKHVRMRMPTAGTFAGEYFKQFAQTLLGGRFGPQSWKLQYLTDLKTLPDYDDPNTVYGYYGEPQRGAPVDAADQPVYHHIPKDFASATTDGERWRWCLNQAATLQPSLALSIEQEFAGFLNSQFGVQTMATWGYLFGRQADTDKKDQAGPYALYTLGDDETIARLATGIRRFKLPDEFNPIKVYQDLAEHGDPNGPSALAQIYEDRQQYSKAADWWRKAGNSQRVRQIEGNWGTFEPAGTQCAGKGATVDFRFRNGQKVSFTAYAILEDKLIADCKAHLESHPAEMDSNLINIGSIGYQLVQNRKREYLGEKVASWDLALEPRPDHFDRRITVTTPLSRGGAYLVAAHMEGGNASYIVLWLNDLAIVKKQLDQKVLYYVTDARTGEPVAGAALDFFGYQNEWEQGWMGGKGHMVVKTDSRTFKTDADGMVATTQSDLPQNFNWLVLAKDSASHWGWMGWTYQGSGSWYDQEYNQTKTFFMTDRPVYRPGQTVKFKFWLNQAQYDREGKSPFAGQRMSFQVVNPKGERSDCGGQDADTYGGADGECKLPADATLGVYQLDIPGRASGSFRVEEYKKPEFEVTVDAPKEPVMLGETFEAKIQAKYLFGAPVKEGKVKYKILHSTREASWYPLAPWDWYYGPGYWWFVFDYEWYPGWSLWGCRRPAPWWIWGGGWAPPQQPDVIAENEAPLNPDGTVTVRIDTGLAKATQGDTDHHYEISAEVTDRSRRTITGSGSVLVARVPFKVYSWVDRGHYHVGDTIAASFHAQTADGKPVTGEGSLKLLKLKYDDNGLPVETPIQDWKLATDASGLAQQQLKASEPGQYRLSYTLADAKGHSAEGGYVFVIAGEGFDGSDFRFNDLELIADRQQYQPGDHVQLRVSTNHRDSTVLLFLRAANGVCLPPKVLRIKGKSALEDIEITKKDMPNFFIEALTVADGKVHEQMLEIIVPPENRILHVDVAPAAEKVKPGAKAKVTVKVTDGNGKPYQGSAVVTMYDKALEYISGGSNVGDIREVFWKWRRSHYPQHETNLTMQGSNMTHEGDEGMSYLGVFGAMVADTETDRETKKKDGGSGGRPRRGVPGMMMKSMAVEEREGLAAPAPAAPGGMAMAAARSEAADSVADEKEAGAANAAGALQAPSPMGGGAAQAGATVQPVIRSNFADTAYWNPLLTFDESGSASVEVTMPENLTTWKTKVWVEGDGARVGQGETEVITTKNLIIRLQAPRFFVEKDEVVLSANVHNYLSSKKSVDVVLELEGGTLALAGDSAAKRTVQVDAGSETRVDWRVNVLREGKATVRMKALTDEESDAMQMEFPCLVHGMLKTESFCGVLRPGTPADTLKIKVPAERKPEQSRLEVRYSPTLAGAMVDALPYLVEYPWGCTEQTLNRFLPTVITKKVLIDLGIDLKDVQDKITNLNAQEVGDDVKRAADWKRLAGTMRWDGHDWVPRNPVFDEARVRSMIEDGLAHLVSMQLSDGGWGWFSGYSEQSWPHTTALVVHGLQIAQYDDVAIPQGVMQRGLEWLSNYQAEQVRLLDLPEKDPYHKSRADALDAFVYMVLVDGKKENRDMRDRLYRDRNELPVYAKCLYAMGLHKVKDIEKRDMLMRNIEQYLVQDAENQSAYLKLPENDWWWYWYGSEFEAEAYYLKLLSAVDPKGEKAARLVKYLVNNRRHATYWNSTRDTALVVEAFADYIRASGENKPDMAVEILVDGKSMKTVKITPDNLFAFDNKLVIEGAGVTTGEHTLTVKRTGEGPLYWNAYLTNFTMEDAITRAGLEIKVNRSVYKLIEEQRDVKAQGSRGQVLDQKVEKYRREEVKDLSTLKSGDLVEVELVIDSKNDYEYILVEDMKAAGFEPVEVRSGYNGNDMGAYVEFHDDRVGFFVRELARGQHSVSYRLRAETPGRFSALPARASAMYAPELKANSDEIKLKIED